MSASEKQPDAPTYTAANVTPLPSAAKKGAIPINGYSVHDTEITHNGQRLYPGVWMHYSNKTREGEEESTHEWLCGPLHVDAITRNQACSEGYGRLLRYTNLDGKELTWAMPSELLAGRPERIVSTLLSRGLRINHRQQREVVNYIASQHPQRRVISTSTTGWVGAELYITPHETIGKGDAIFQSESTAEGEYGRAGTLEGWQQSIGAMLPGSCQIVTNRTPDAQQLINTFRHSDCRWIVAVGMISEGTDIPRLQVCCYLSRIRTELHYRQVLGRVLRRKDESDDEAWLFMLAEPTLRRYAERIADDLPDDLAVLSVQVPDPASGSAIGWPGLGFNEGGRAGGEPDGEQVHDASVANVVSLDGLADGPTYQVSFSQHYRQQLLACY